MINKFIVFFSFLYFSHIIVLFFLGEFELLPFSNTFDSNNKLFIYKYEYGLDFYMRFKHLYIYYFVTFFYLTFVHTSLIFYLKKFNNRLLFLIIYFFGMFFFSFVFYYFHVYDDTISRIFWFYIDSLLYYFGIILSFMLVSIVYTKHFFRIYDKFR